MPDSIGWRRRAGRTWATLRHVTATQLLHRIGKLLRQRVRRHAPGLSRWWLSARTRRVPPWSADPSPVGDVLLDHDAALQQARDVIAGRFRFVGQTRDVGEAPVWAGDAANPTGYLWLYNLHYFEYLEALATLGAAADADEAAIAVERGSALVHDWIARHPYPSQPGWVPYALSMRLVFWQRFLARFPEAPTEAIRRSVYEQLVVLHRNVERDLVNNHTIENLAGVLFGAAMLAPSRRIQRWRAGASRNLRRELAVQVASDGALVERSAMYQAIILSRLLMLRPLNVAGLCDLPDLDDTITRMAGALRRYVMPDGALLGLNDSAGGVAPPASRLFEAVAAEGLTVCEPPPAPRADLDGVRLFTCVRGRYRCDVDAGEPLPRGNPAHTHAAAGAFVLYRQGRPIVVDPGCSTYDPGPQRDRQRSTASHNTISVDGLDQCQLWSQFRIGRRARVDTNLKNSEDGVRLTVTHDGFGRQGVAVIHRRQFMFRDDCLVIADELCGRGRHTIESLITFAPGVDARPQRPPDNSAGIETWTVGDDQCGVALHYNQPGMLARVEADAATAFGVTATTTALKLRAEVDLPWSAWLVVADTGTQVRRIDTNNHVEINGSILHLFA